MAGTYFVTKRAVQPTRVALTEEAAEARFRRDGAVVLRGMYSPDTLDAAYRFVLAREQETAEAIKAGKSLKVGNNRYMVSFDIEGPMGAPELLANPKVIAILRRLLGEDMILGSLTVVIARPGAKAQAWHRDTDALFPETRDLPLPPFCISLMIPLIPFTRETGTTEVVPGTHVNRRNDDALEPEMTPFTRLGDCYLMDIHALHRGQANKSEINRPLLCIIYQRRWYRDTQNFSKDQPPLTITPETISGLPEADRGLVDWVTWMP